MKDSLRRILVVLLISGFLSATVAQAQNQDTGWVINSFHSDFRIHPDGSIYVVERIEVDFGDLQRHGIYREIPVRYRKVVRTGLPVQAGTMKLDLEDIRVTDESGNARQIEITRGNLVRIRIGDPDRLVSGRQVYVINYRLSSGLGFFEDHDELYWQVTGVNWPVPIMRASATVTLPEAGLSAANDTSGWSAWCYAGWAESSSSERCTATVTAPGRYGFESARLEPGEGLTLVAAFPKGVVPEPTVAEKAASIILTWWPAALPLIALAVMWTLWWRHGREPDVGSIVPMWHRPERLPPGAAGTLVDQQADMDDVVATLLDLAVRGYIRIREVEPAGLLGVVDEDSFTAKALRTLGLYKVDWELQRTDKKISGDGLSLFEKNVLDGIFEGKSTRLMSDLHNEFYTHLPEIREGMYDFLVSDGLFRKSPRAVRIVYVVAGIVVSFLGFIAAAATENWILGVGILLTGVIILLFSWAMPAMTTRGASKWREVKGLEEYIRRAEKAELEFSQSPERTTDLFASLLPYAVALNVSDLWVQQFAAQLASSPPVWYTGMHPGSFSVNHFQSGLSDFRTAATRTMGSSPGSSSGSGGGGSVGGGGGGGGGGSW